jgi:alpha-amylase
VTTNAGGKVPEAQWPNVRDLIRDVASTTKRSTQPAIYGMVAMAEVERLRTGGWGGGVLGAL